MEGRKTNKNMSVEACALTYANTLTVEKKRGITLINVNIEPGRKLTALSC